jgi:hypothetical protein
MWIVKGARSSRIEERLRPPQVVEGHDDVAITAFLGQSFVDEGVGIMEVITHDPTADRVDREVERAAVAVLSRVDPAERGR